MSKSIYIVDDEENILDIITLNLEKNGYKVKAFTHGIKFLEAFNSKEPDLAIIDLMLPDIDGYDICRKIKSKSSIPVIILSAKSEEFDKVLGLELGADDYMTKPFGVRELVARVKNIFKRIDVTKDVYMRILKEDIYFDDIKLSIDEEKHEIYLDDRLIKLNPKEFQTVTLLLKNIDNLSSRQDIIKLVWGDDYYGDTRTLDVHIRRIREKTSYKDFGKKYIKTVHGYGYKMLSKI